MPGGRGTPSTTAPPRAGSGSVPARPSRVRSAPAGACGMSNQHSQPPQSTTLGPGMWQRVRALVVGPLLAMGTIGAIEIADSFGIHVPNPPSLLVMIVVFSAFLGGLGERHGDPPHRLHVLRALLFGHRSAVSLRRGQPLARHRLRADDAGDGGHGRHRQAPRRSAERGVVAARTRALGFAAWRCWKSGRRPRRSCTWRWRRPKRRTAPRASFLPTSATRSARR